MQKNWVKIWQSLANFEASSHDRINMTKFWFEHDQTNFTRTNFNVGTWPKNCQWWTSTFEHEQKIYFFAEFCHNFLLFLPFSAFLCKNIVKANLNQRLECAAPKCWSKYATMQKKRKEVINLYPERKMFS